MRIAQHSEVVGTAANGALIHAGDHVPGKGARDRTPCDTMDVPLVSATASGPSVLHASFGNPTISCRAIAAVVPLVRATTPRALGPQSWTLRCVSLSSQRAPAPLAPASRASLCLARFACVQRAAPWHRYLRKEPRISTVLVYHRDTPLELMDTMLPCS